MKSWVCLGEIVAAHGIKGQVKIKTFTQIPENLIKYGPLVDAKQQLVEILSFRKNSPTTVIATIDDITNRNQAELLKGVQLFVNQEQLPPLLENEIYHAALIGLPLMAAGKTLGEVIGVYDFGAGGFCEIKIPSGKVATIHLTSCSIFQDHLECDVGNLLV